VGSPAAEAAIVFGLNLLTGDRTDEDSTEFESGLRTSGVTIMKIQTHKPVVMNTAVWFAMLSPLMVLVVGLVGALLVG